MILAEMFIPAICQYHQSDGIAKVRACTRLDPTHTPLESARTAKMPTDRYRKRKVRIRAKQRRPPVVPCDEAEH